MKSPLYEVIETVLRDKAFKKPTMAWTKDDVQKIVDNIPKSDEENILNYLREEIKKIESR